MAAASSGVVLSARSIVKGFSGVSVLKGVELSIHAGETHVLAGENGAGKSTLIKILAGVHEADSGVLEGVRPRDVAVVYQELSLVDSLSVVDNLFLGRERRGQRALAREHFARLGLALDLDRLVGGLTLGEKSLLELAKALLDAPKVVVMDEPTSALNRAECEQLYGWIAGLKARGCAIIYISHRMEEIYRLADRITVLRDGVSVGTWAAGELPEAELVSRMVGRELGEYFPPREPKLGETRLEAEIDGVSLKVARGEILGVAGLQGSGMHELLEGIFGARAASGRVKVDGVATGLDPRRSIAGGIGLVTSDRKRTGLCLGLSVHENLMLATRRSSRPRSETRIRELRIRCTGPEQEVRRLSGGNQQKVVLGKWLETEPKVLLLSEPTRGVDVGARREIYDWLNRWTSEGGSVVLASTDLPELLALSDRVLVLHRGRASAELSRAEATPERVMTAALGGSHGH